MARQFAEIDPKPMAKWEKNLTTREISTVDFSRLYRQHFGHGAEGDHSMQTIAKMAALLDQAEAAGHKWR